MSVSDGIVPICSATRCRNCRITRCRCTELPTTLPTTKPALGAVGSGRVMTWRTRCAEAMRRPRRITSRRSADLRNRCGCVSIQTAISWRPLRRRAERMARPARVRMRRRKPCFLWRLRLFGWKVRFTTCSGKSVGRDGGGRRRANGTECPVDWSKRVGAGIRTAVGRPWPLPVDKSCPAAQGPTRVHALNGPHLWTTCVRVRSRHGARTMG